MAMKRRSNIAELVDLPAPKEQEYAVTTVSVDPIYGNLDSDIARRASALSQISGDVLPVPKSMSPDDLLKLVRCSYSGSNVENTYRQRIRSPLTAIRGYCVLCAGGPRAANNCDLITCPLYPFRTGKNPFYGKLKQADTEAVD